MTTFARGLPGRGALCALLLLLFAVAPLGAQDSAAAGPVRGPQDPAELEAFLDGVLTAWLRDKHVAGATVSVVKDGQLFFAKGYGYADVAARKPVDPEKTLFRIGSISKTFTWTGVMQLVEQGKIDLDADVNTYLDFQIPATYPEPITMFNFLTHTPGLEEDGRDLFTEDPEHLTPMGEWLPAHMPGRVRPPGTYSSYSNWGTATAGYIIERVSGQSYDDYLDANVFAPIGMTQVTARQPLPARFEPDMSVGYAWENGAFVPKKWEIVTGAAPAGSMSASATAMAKWMLAHLNHGQLGEGRILSAETADRMHARAFVHDSRLPGFALGFYEKSSHGLRIFGHGGDTGWFHSDMALIPSENLGIFVSFNTNTGGALSFGPFLTAFLDHYYPYGPPPPPKKADDLARFAGEYLFNRMSYTTYQKVLGLASAMPVAVGPDTTLVLQSPFGAIRLYQIDSLLFANDDGEPMLAFRTDDRGNVTHGFIGMAPMMTMEKQTGLTAPNPQRLLLGFALVVFVGFLISAVTRFFRQRRHGGTGPAPSLVRGRRLLAWAALANLAFIAFLGVKLATGAESLFSDSTGGLKVALVLPVVALLLVLAAGWFAVRVWREGAGNFWDRFRYTGVVLAGLIFAWSLNVWNLLGWRM
ncbi:MAG: serine hydrolase domain-containing protein [Gemmatimonadales bacterium]